MKILSVIHTPKSPYSAVYRNYLRLVAPFAAAGHTLTILAPEDVPGLGRVHARWYPLLYPLFVASWLRRHRDVDVVTFHSYAGWFANLLGLCRGRAVTAFHGLEPLNYEEVRQEMARVGQPYRWRFRLLHGALLPALMRGSCRRSAMVLCLNEEERRYLVDHKWSEASRIHVVGHGVDDTWFFERQSLARARRVLFVGQWIPRKGCAYLVEAFERLARAHPDLELHCVGTLAGAETVRQPFTPEVRGRVLVVPKVPHEQLVDHYRDADLFVFPSLIDGFGIALLEAMATGLPIVTTPAGWAQDALTDGQSALFVPKRDPEAIVRAVERLVGDAALRSTLGHGAQAAARQYHIDRIAADRIALLRSLMSGTESPCSR